jgi:hypothetical protein
MEHSARVPVECPLCHWRHFMEIQVQDALLNTPVAAEIRSQLEAWLASRCPDHLGLFLETSKN